MDGGRDCEFGLGFVRPRARREDTSNCTNVTSRNRVEHLDEVTCLLGLNMGQGQKRRPGGCREVLAGEGFSVTEHHWQV